MSRQNKHAIVRFSELGDNWSAALTLSIKEEEQAVNYILADLPKKVQEQAEELDARLKQWREVDPDFFMEAAKKVYQGSKEHDKLSAEQVFSSPISEKSNRVKACVLVHLQRMLDARRGQLIQKQENIQDQLNRLDGLRDPKLSSEVKSDQPKKASFGPR